MYFRIQPDKRVLHPREGGLPNKSDGVDRRTF